MSIKDILDNKKVSLSFEVFPPKKKEALESIKETAVSLTKLKPDFISVTFGAGGTTKGYTAEIAETIESNGTTSLAHLTCVRSTTEALKNTIDDLKNRNDKYGHSEGDNGIKLVANAVRSITDDNEICVRGGGDEFFIIGVGGYTDAHLREKISRFRGYIETANENMTIPVEASIGYSLENLDKSENIQVVLDKADAKMYEDKRSKKSGVKK